MNGSVDVSSIPLEERRPDIVASDDVKRATIFSPELLASPDNADDKPLILVGLPRSGSSFLSDLISQSGHYFVFDDLYLARAAEERGCVGRLTEAQLDELLHFLGWQIRARIRFKRFSVPHMLQSDVDPMNAAIKAAYAADPSGDGPTWVDLQREWLTRLCRLNGCKDWGFNLPGAFLSIDSFRKAYPGARFLFLFRNPQDVLASFKYISRHHTDGNPGQYHPIVYAHYWRKSVDAYRAAKAKSPDRVTMTTFDRVTSDPATALTEVAAFFDFDASAEVKTAAPNTSFRKNSRRTITGLEAAILKRAAGRQIDFLGFEAPAGQQRVGDLLDFLFTTARFTWHQGRRIARNPGVLRRMGRFISAR